MTCPAIDRLNWLRKNDKVSDAGADPADERVRDPPARGDSRNRYAAGAGRKALADLPATSQYGVWRPLGPSNYGGKVYDLAVDPRNANVVFAAYGAGGEIGTTNGGGLWRTLNGGESWAPAVDRARDTGFLCVKAHPKVAGYLAAGLRSISYNQDGGVLLSTDGGVTWQSIGPPDPTLSVNDIALNPNDPDTLYAATQNLLLKTVDRGKSWKVLLSYTTPALWADLPTIIMHPNDPQTLLLAQRSLGVVRSSDGGATWTRVDTDWDQNDRQTMLAWSPSDGNIVYAERVLPQRVKEDGATRQMAMYRSADAGRTWTRMSVREAYHQERYDMSLTVDPTDSNRVIVANTEMIISTDGLRTFASPYNRPHDDHLRTVFAPSDPKIVYNGNDGGVWKSADRGFGWVRADHDVETTHVFSFAVAGDSGMIYLSAGDYDGMFYHPQFGWHDLGCGDEFQQFFVNPHDPSDVYVGSPLRRVGGPSAICAEIDPAKSEIRLTHQAMAFDPVDANTIYLGLEHIWKSQDRGAHWHSIGINEKAAGLHQPIVALQVAPGAANMIYALVGGSGDLWFSPDGGADWSSGFQVPAPTALAVSPRDAPHGIPGQRPRPLRFARWGQVGCVAGRIPADGRRIQNRDRSCRSVSLVRRKQQWRVGERGRGRLVVTAGQRASEGHRGRSVAGESDALCFQQSGFMVDGSERPCAVRSAVPRDAFRFAAARKRRRSDVLRCRYRTGMQMDGDHRRRLG